MTFATRTKLELCQINVKKDCCKKALLYGILLFAASFQSSRVKLITESDATCELTLKLLRDLYKIEGNLYVTEKKQRDDDGDIVRSNKITVSVKADAEKLYYKLGGGDGDKINRGIFACESCKTAFLRGVFLSAATLNNPESENRLEFTVRSQNIASELIGLLAECDVTAKLGKRLDDITVYIKATEQIENLLGVVGASSALFELMNSRIVKDAKNDANRKRNCDTANLGRTVSAADAQVKAVQSLIDSGRISLLPDELCETAYLRLENPELSIKDFGLLFDPPISKSGINHRLKKIMDFAEKNS